VSFEHAAPDEPPQRAVREEHHLALRDEKGVRADTRVGHFVASVGVHWHLKLLKDRPDRLVCGIVVADPDIHAWQEDPSE
jgi:hypothetical protein